jgi:hypothetical protein
MHAHLEVEVRSEASACLAEVAEHLPARDDGPFLDDHSGLVRVDGYQAAAMVEHGHVSVRPKPPGKEHEPTGCRPDGGPVIASDVDPGMESAVAERPGLAPCSRSAR